MKIPGLPVIDVDESEKIAIAVTAEGDTKDPDRHPIAIASQIAAASGAVELDGSGVATVQMDSAPDSPPSAATNLISFWQMNLAGLLAQYWAQNGFALPPSG